MKTFTSLEVYLGEQARATIGYERCTGLDDLWKQQDVIRGGFHVTPFLYIPLGYR